MASPSSTVEKGVLSDGSLWRQVGEFAALMAIVFILSVACKWLWPDPTNGLAAWVQAFGSIGAIIGGVAGVRMSVRRAAAAARNERRAREIDMVRASYAIVRHASLALYKVVGALEDTPAKKPIAVSRLEDLQESLQILVGKDLPPTALTHVLHAKRELAYALADLRARNLEAPTDLTPLLKKAKARHRRAKEARIALRALGRKMQQTNMTDE